MTVVVGVDGGGTRTRALVADQDARELGRAEAAGAVVCPDGAEAAIESVSKVVRAAAEVAGVGLPVDRLWAGLAGAGTQERGAAVARELGGRGLADQVVVGSDVEAAFHDAFGNGPGILLIAGTGSIAWGRGPEGETVRVGGWGERLGDEGSGFAIGMAASAAVLRAEDGRGQRTLLGEAVLERLSLEGPDDLVGWAANASKGDVAALVPVVSAAAAAGDPVATEILDRAAADLADHVVAVLERSGPWADPPELVLWGGLLQNDGTLRERTVGAVGSLPVRLVGGLVDPAMGAVKLALAARG